MSVNEHCVNLGPKSGASLCNVVVEEPALVLALLLLWGADLCVCVCGCVFLQRSAGGRRGTITTSHHFPATFQFEPGHQ